eukprot:4339143-Pyramimonas_sp.AAC.1
MRRRYGVCEAAGRPRQFRPLEGLVRYCMCGGRWTPASRHQTQQCAGANGSVQDHHRWHERTTSPDSVGHGSQAPQTLEGD